MSDIRGLKDCWYVKYLACPDCHQAMSVSEEIRCAFCGYAPEPTIPISIKPCKPLPLNVTLSRDMCVSAEDALGLIPTVPPAISYDGPSAMRDSRSLMSEISKYVSPGGQLLDLGCGPRDQKEPVAYLGCQYVGIDYSNTHADLLADAHAIPFQDETFDCVLSYAVLEHLHNPFIAIREVERVLKPGGVYVGTVSQGEPFHASFFHHTSWGFLSLVSSVPNLQVERLWSSGDTLFSLARMGGYPKIIKQLIRGVAGVHHRFPWLAPRKMRWSQKKRELDALYRAGSVCFVVRKEKESVRLEAKS